MDPGRTLGNLSVYCTPASELNFHIWNANWPRKREAKMAAHGGQSCTSV